MQEIEKYGFTWITPEYIIRKPPLKKWKNLVLKGPQPPFSPDIAPSDFFLFGYLTDKLRGQLFTSFDDLQERIIEILTEISHEILIQVFQTWIDRCKWVSTNRGVYYKK